MESCHHELTPMEVGAKDWLVPHNKQADLESTRLFQCMMGSINYLSYQTRMDISFASHIKGGRRILRNLAGTKYLAIKFERGEGDRQKLCGYSDANFANYDKAGYRSHSGWLFFLSGGVISSSSKLQSTVALSTTECKRAKAKSVKHESNA
ncbi:Secreted RxLR effector protein [Erysiphe necator]|nr:Secreted RxLR effector protein [Erysiphe necator]